jgi:DNA-binding PadR family transcriptional regulator
MNLLTRLEEAILIAVLKLGDDAYGVPINREVSRIFQKSYTMGGLYFALDQLVRKEYLMKKTDESSRSARGRTRSYYRLTLEGQEALDAVRVHQIQLWHAAASPAGGEER